MVVFDGFIEYFRKCFILGLERSPLFYLMLLCSIDDTLSILHSHLDPILI